MSALANAVSAELDARNNASADLERLREDWRRADKLLLQRRLILSAGSKPCAAAEEQASEALDALEAHKAWMADLALEAVRAVLPGITWDQIREIAP